MTQDVAQRIVSEIDSADVVVFLCGTPIAPSCGYSTMMVQILAKLDVDYHSVDVTDSALRKALREHSHWPRIPQLYFKGELIGSAELVRILDEEGKLEALLGR